MSDNDDIVVLSAPEPKDDHNHADDIEDIFSPS